MSLAAALVPRAEVSRVGKNESVQYASRWRDSNAFREATAHPRGTEWYWFDPLVLFVLSQDAAGYMPLPPADDPTAVTAFVYAVEELDGFRAGWWPEVKRSAGAVAHVMASVGGDFGDWRDSLEHAFAAEYDARAAEREAFHADDPPEEKPRNLPRLRVRAIDTLGKHEAPGGALLVVALLALAALGRLAGAW